MQKKNLRSVDLNLLVVLDALLDERSVTRAAARLFLTQPATSHALDRLRSLFDDALLERHGTTMALTPKAEELQRPLRDLLEDVQRLVNVAEVPLKELSQTVHLAMPDFPAALLVPPLWAHLQKIAPRLALVVHGWSDNARELERLRRGEVGLVLSALDAQPDDIEKVRVAEERYVGIAAKRHPVGAAPTLQQFVSYPHVLVSAVGARTSAFDKRLAARGQTRYVGISVPTFLSVPAIVAASNALAMIPRSLARHWGPAKMLAQFKLPIDPGSFGVDLAWHRRRSHDPAILAVRSVMVDVLKATLQ
jgi:DNA-binding transcriptional LysR family regulator